MADTENTTDNAEIPDNKKSGKKLTSKKVSDDIEKKGVTISGGKPNPININPVVEQTETTAVTNLNMRAQPPHKGHALIIKAVEDEAKKVGGSAHIVTSHSQGDEKNPIPTAKKVGYIKKMASPGTHVSATSREAPSIFHTAVKLNRHAHHLVVVAGSDRAGEYEKLLNKYNGKEGPHGIYNFKSITVKSIGRDPDAQGTAGVSGTKMREYAKNGNIAGFKSGLHPDLHQHAEEMMNDINSASKKKMKESIDNLFGETFIDTDDTVRVLEAIEALLNLDEGNSLWDNIHAKRKRIKAGSGERMRKPGEKGAPSAADLKSAQESMEIDEEADTGLAAKSKKSGISLSTLRKVYNRGMAAWNSGHRPGTTPQQWAMARVNSYITKGKGTYGGADKDLHEMEENYSSSNPKYHAGLNASTKAARVAHWKRADKMSDRDPRAYEPAPGDATTKTKPSKYTKLYNKMYGDKK